MMATQKAHVAHATPAPTPQQHHAADGSVVMGFLFLIALGVLGVVFAWRMFWGALAWAGNQQRQRGR